MHLGFVVLDHHLRIRGVGSPQPALPWTAGLTVRGELAELAAASADETLIDAVRRARREGVPDTCELRPRGGSTVVRSVQAIRGVDSAQDGVLITWAAGGDAAAKRQTDLHFISVLTHDLRTPLGALSLWTRLLEQEENSPEQTREAAEMIHRGAEELRDQIDDLGDMARLLSGRARLVDREFALRPLLYGAIEAKRMSAIDAGVALEVELDPALGIVRADPARIQQVLGNLLSNAIKFTSENGEVRVLARRDGAEVEISVSDTGAGIPPELLPKIFDRSTARSAAPEEAGRGLGLGLPVVQEIVALHHGRVFAESAGPGRGATFRVRLPLPPVTADRTHERENGSSGLRAKTIVLVLRRGDDCKQMVEALCAAQASPLVVDSVEAARPAIARRSADAWVAILGPPEIDPAEFIDSLRAYDRTQARLRRPPAAVALMFSPGGAGARRALQAGFALCLPRDSSAQTIVTAVDLALHS